MDTACEYLMNTIQTRLDSVPEGKGKNANKTRAKKQERLLHQLLGTNEGKRGPKFADPAEVLNKP